MFREMRRKKQALSQEEIFEILFRGTSGVLALDGENGYPYAVPLSYVFDGEKIYFHSALSGHKLDALLRNPKASFCVIDQDQILPDKYTTAFRSVIVFGRIEMIQDEQRKRRALEKLAVKYESGDILNPEEPASKRTREIERELKAVCILEMKMDHLSGKEGIELVRQKSLLSQSNAENSEKI